MIKKETKILGVLFILATIMYGGFYTWSKAVLIVLFAAVLLWFSMREKNTLTVRFAEPEAIVVLIVLTSFWAIDRSYNLEGIIYGVAILLFKVIADNFEESAVDDSLQILPYIGAANTLAGLITIPFGTDAGFLWQADRLGGIFQYSNTCALFMLIGLAIEFERNEKKPAVKYVLEVLLIIGLLLTGSRMVALLFVGWAVYKFVTTKEKRKNIGIGAVLAAGFIAIYVAVTGSMQNVGRLFTIATSNSTVWGRILYIKDGVRMLIKHPLGLGYKGYYLIQGAEQQGVYDTQFVHNDFIQTGLDYGVLAMAFLVIIVAGQLIKGKQDGIKKEIIVLAAVGCLGDFHMQYPVILMILVCCLDLEKGIFNFSFEFKGQKLGVTVGALILAVAGIYFAIGYGSLEQGDYETALTLLKNNTLALEEKLEECADAKEAEELINKILKQDEYSALALNYKVYLNLQEAQYESAVEAAMDSLAKDKYNSELYSTYYNLFASYKASVPDAAAILEDGLTQIKSQLAYTKANTDSVAAHLKDQGEFDEFELE